MIVIGSSIAILHGIYNDIKQPLGWLTTIMLDTFGLFAATRIALAIGGRASLPLSHTSLWNTPLTALGGVKPFQLVDLAGVAVLIPSMLWVMGSLMERALSCLMRISNRRRECNAADDDRHMIGVCGIKHRFSQAGAAYRVKDRIKTAMRDVVRAMLGESACVIVRWHDADDTVEVEVSTPAKVSENAEGNERLALGLAEELARIDGEDAKRN